MKMVKSLLLGRCSPWKVPLAPLTVRPFRCLRCPLGTGMTGRGDLGMPPPSHAHTNAHAPTGNDKEAF